MNPIVNSTQQTLKEFNEVMRQLSDEQFSESLPIFSGSSIGMHARHVVEFYQCLLAKNIEKQGINYDKRQRDLLLQTDKSYFNLLTDLVVEQLGQLKKEALGIPLSIFSDEMSTEDEPVSSSIGRELQYNLEHTIHHAALIKIGVLTLNPDAYMPKSFGVAASTIRYKEQKPVAA